MKPLFIITLFISFSIKAQCVFGDCQDGFGVIEKSGGTYYGTFKDGELNGIGILATSDLTDIAYGEFVKGTMTGSILVANDKMLKHALYFNNEALTDRYIISDKMGGVHFPLSSEDEMATENYTDVKNGDCFLGDCEEGWGAQIMSEGYFICKNTNNAPTSGSIIVYKPSNENVMFALGPKIITWAKITFSNDVTFFIETYDEEDESNSILTVGKGYIEYVVIKNNTIEKQERYENEVVSTIFNKANNYIITFKQLLNKQRNFENKEQKKPYNFKGKLNKIISKTGQYKDSIQQINDLLKDSRYSNALQKVENMISEYSTIAEPYAYRGLIKFLMDQNDRSALEDINTAINMDSQDGFSNWAAGLVLKSLEKEGKACEYFQTALDAGYEKAREMLKTCN